MEDLYLNLKQFWDKAFSQDEPTAYPEKWVEDEAFNKALKTYIKPDGTLLDYGSGSGWGLMEASYTVPVSEGIGIDPSPAGVAYANESAKLSGLSHLTYVCGDENALDAYPEYFDSALSINVLDVLPDEVIERILAKLRAAMKPGAYVFVGINPDFPRELLEKNGFEYQGRFLFKDGVLRGNEKSADEWTQLFEKYFRVAECGSFALTEREKNYPRRMFILQK